MKRNRDSRPIGEQLAGAERGLQLIKETRGNDERRVMLGCLLFDLIAIEKALARKGGTAAEQARCQTLATRAWEMQRRIGSPIKDPSGPLHQSRVVRKKPAQRPPALRVRADRGQPPEDADPVLSFWLSQGFTRRAAAGLRQANVFSLDDMALLSAERLLAIPGIGEEEMRRCERLLGGGLHRKARYWTSRGISRWNAGSLVRAGIDTLDHLARLTKGEFFLGRGLGEGALRQCEALLGRPLASPEDDWLKAGCPRWLLARKLVRAKILTVEDLRRAKDEELWAAGLKRHEIDQCARLLKKRRRRW